MDALTNVAAAEQTIERLQEQNPDLDSSLIAIFMTIAEVLDEEPRADLVREFRLVRDLLKEDAADGVVDEDDDFQADIQTPGQS